jgi:hypothetical protein
MADPAHAFTLDPSLQVGKYDIRRLLGEMAWIYGGTLVRQATVDSMTDLLVAEFLPEALARVSPGGQLYLTRALVRNLVDRLALANTRLAR